MIFYWKGDSFMKRLILASGSPRRKDLLEQARLSFITQTSDTEEVVDDRLSPEEVVQSLALQKAAAVAINNKDAVVLGADTIVVYQEHILGKPVDEKDAMRMLRMLSGSTHSVYTGVALVTSEQETAFCTETKVTFWELTEEEISFYVATGQPADKAGSYGIQDFGATFVKEIQGDYFSVVGLPLSKTVRELKKLGITSNDL